MAKGKAKILKSTMIYEGPVFGVRRDQVNEPDGLRAMREVITHTGSVVVLPALSDGRIVMVRQYRHAARQYLWELVAGRIDKGETVKQAAARELLEETGYRAKGYSVFLHMFPSPGFLEEQMHIVQATGLTEGEAQPEDDEQIEVGIFGVKELQQMIQRRRLLDGKSIAGLLYYFTFLR